MSLAIFFFFLDTVSYNHGLEQGIPCIYIWKTSKSVIAAQIAFLAHFMLCWNDAILDRKSILLLVETSIWNNIIPSVHIYLREVPNCMVANMLAFNVVVTIFELQLRYHIYFQTNTFGKDMNPLISPHPAMGSIVLKLFFYKDGIDIN